MKQAPTAFAAIALFVAFTAPAFAQQPATAPAQKGQAPSPTDLNLNKRSESGAQATTGSGAATGAGQPQGAAQPPAAQSPGSAKAKSQTRFKDDTGTRAKRAADKKKKRGPGKRGATNSDDPTAGDVPPPR
jgi:hypothetical protein